MATEHTYRAHVSWQTDAAGAEVGNHRIDFDGRPSIDVSAAPEFRGDGSRLNPEELFLSSLAACQMLTYRYLVDRAGIRMLSYEDEAEATVTMADRKMRVTEVRLRPRITLAADADEDKARSLVERAHDGCFIANSVSCAVRIDPEIRKGS